jgi:DNA-binding response OmpR family regulator
MPNGKRVLIVEDDEAANHALAAILTVTGWTACQARTVAEAVACFGILPDVVLLDLMLPDGDGMTVLHKLRQTGSRARVIVMTGAHREGDSRLWGEGVETVMSKPLDLSTLFFLMAKP